MTPQEVEQLRTQNAMLLRALQRATQEREELLKRLASLQPEPVASQ